MMLLQQRKGHGTGDVGGLSISPFRDVYGVRFGELCCVMPMCTLSTQM
jgi:hypothetical protein